MIKNFIFLGYPGSGKGSVAKCLPEFTQISTGDLLRKEVASGSKLGKEIAARIDAGQFIDDAMAIGLIQSNFSATGQYIFDGFPRTLPQAQMLDTILNVEESIAVLFEIDRNLLSDRIVYRRSCPKCGAIYNLKMVPPKTSDTCDTCGHQGLFHRADDKLEVLEERFKLYEKNGPSLVEYYRQQNRLIVVDSSGNGGDSFSSLAEQLRNVQKGNES